MTILKSIFLALTISVMMSCSSDNKAEQSRESVVSEKASSKEATPEQPAYVAPTSLIKIFSKLPPEIDGCACYFSTNENEFEAGNYIYADNFENIGFMSIDGKMVKFDLKELPSGEKETIKSGVSDEYDLIIKMKQVGQVDETWQQEGTIAVRKKNEAPITKIFYGECGC